jgi:para-nitrobenzyl esterase
MDTVFETNLGKLRGHGSDGVIAFKGVRYAAPPFGANRQRPPQLVERWDGVRDAFTFGPKSPQVSYPPGIAEALSELVGAGEDCLTLNVWTPDLGPVGHPVMLWIPGGMFEFHATGATAFYDGSRFARDGVVCVTINYRVGAEGFLYLDDGVANLGLLDQIAALEWVHENIAVFGGDPGKVTIFGESAGAMSVATLLSMPRAKGLFHRAIVESGTAHNVNSAETAARIGRRFAEKLGVAATRKAIAARLPPSACFRLRRSCGMIFLRVPIRRSGARLPSATSRGRPRSKARRSRDAPSTASLPARPRTSTCWLDQIERKRGCFFCQMDPSTASPTTLSWRSLPPMVYRSRP